MSTEQLITVTNTRPEHAEGAARVLCLALRIDDCTSCLECMKAPNILQHLKQFAEGQFVGLAGDQVVAMAVTMRTNHQPAVPVKRWIEAIGGLDCTNHEPDGEWLYGCEFGVNPAFQGKGIGTMMYEVRFNLIRRLNLRGFMAVGSLMGYHRYRDQMTALEYGNKVITGEVTDPTVTMQMHRGFRPIGVVENYLNEADAGNTGVLIVWENPDYKAGT